MHKYQGCVGEREGPRDSQSKDLVGVGRVSREVPAAECLQRESMTGGLGEGGRGEGGEPRSSGPNMLPQDTQLLALWAVGSH